MTQSLLYVVAGGTASVESVWGARVISSHLTNPLWNVAASVKSTSLNTWLIVSSCPPFSGKFFSCTRLFRSHGDRHRFRPYPTDGQVRRGREGFCGAAAEGEGDNERRRTAPVD